eukprot:26882-Eustigmatos_ZCMA.PRE.1
MDCVLEEWSRIAKWATHGHVDPTICTRDTGISIYNPDPVQMTRHGRLNELVQEIVIRHVPRTVDPPPCTLAPEAILDMVKRECFLGRSGRLELLNDLKELPMLVN